MLLAIDTATRVMSLALHDGHTLLADVAWQSGNQHNTLLAPSVQRLLAQCEATVDDLTALGVSIGPGSYTGLRIGVAFAKGIASIHDLPLVGVTTLDTLAMGQPHYQTRHGLIAVAQAGRKRIVAKTYRWGRGRWVGRSEPQIMNWEELFDSVDAPAYLTGEVDAAGREALEARTKDVPVVLAPAAYRLRRAGFLAEAAWVRLKAGKEDFTAAKLTPIYLKTTAVP